MFIYCDDCRWSQDDFWSEDKDGYSPFRPDIVENLRKSLFKEKIYFDRFVLEDLHLPIRKDENGYYAIGQEYVAMKLIAKAKSIMNMQVKTGEEWKEVKDSFVCPECGSTHIEVD